MSLVLYSFNPLCGYLGCLLGAPYTKNDGIGSRAGYPPTHCLYLISEHGLPRVGCMQTTRPQNVIVGVMSICGRSILHRCEDGPLGSRHHLYPVLTKLKHVLLIRRVWPNYHRSNQRIVRGHYRSPCLESLDSHFFLFRLECGPLTH